MAEFRLHAGGTIELLTKGELDEALGRAVRQADEIWRQYAYGLKHMSLPVMRGTPSDGALSLGASNVAEQINCGPKQGYSWRVSRVSVYGLASGDTVLLWKADPSPAAYVATLTAAGGSSGQCGASWTNSRGLLLRPGDHLVVTAGTVASTSPVAVSGEADEAPAELAYKLIGG